MAGFDDLIPAAMPYLAREELDASTGSSWEWEYLIDDNAGDPVDFTGITGVCEIHAKGDSGVLIAPTVTLTTGKVTVTATAAQTTGLAAGQYRHEVELTRTSDSAVVKVVGSGDSVFNIKGEVTV